MWSVNGIVAAVIAALNIHAFVLYGVDKRRARRQQWRISEKRLLLSALCFGAGGAYAGMKAFRHKTQHRVFYVGVPAMGIVQLGLLVWLIYKQIF